ncbi:hypothetical protein [Paraburkholderia phenazinium]|uniref:Uncharacterized protein n=1 Tax=Paraburkholderia phenazinium TaxID=60549 RepID=A0A1N6JNS5_9BURK|nr:hypothetical protein [Paraburkholderia phenazinium]SIO45807.1 hypothetical protein SAMN05444168_4710 [Paraburkholderia phenazinium]
MALPSFITLQPVVTGDGTLQRGYRFPRQRQGFGQTLLAGH